MNDSEQKASTQDSRFMTITKFAWEEKAQQVKNLEAKVEEMQKTLEWYADTENYRLRNADEYDAGGFAKYHVMGDNGERARQALKGDPK